MQIIEQSWDTKDIESSSDGILICKDLEAACRTCYQSFHKTDSESYKSLLKSAIAKGHHSVLEHKAISVYITTDRAVMAELTRHRIGTSFSIESQRYCNYKDGVQFIRPVFFDIDTDRYRAWFASCAESEQRYNELLSLGCKPQEARTVLNNSVAVRMYMTANIREWRHIFTLRTSPAAYPQIRVLCADMLSWFQKTVPVLFDDIGEETK
jgi:thymidylate synthase (FAD)